MRERVTNLAANALILVTIGIAAFTGQVVANYISLFGTSPIVNRIEALETRMDAAEGSLNKKIGF